MNHDKIEVRLHCLYRRSWEDGFGARGWKLADSEGDPEVIASSSETGDRIPTAVFVHDILDHALCGLGSSGHRNEAIALLQLALRTGSDPTPDFAQMVDEDLLCGRAVGEELLEFLPHDLAVRLPENRRCDADMIDFLMERLGREKLRARLISRFRELGKAGAAAAKQHYISYGLDYGRRAPLGLALQALFNETDVFAKRNAWAIAKGSVWITDLECGFTIDTPDAWSTKMAY